MADQEARSEQCSVCGKTMPRDQIVSVAMVRDSVLDTIRKSKPDLPATGFICIDDLNEARMQSIQELLQADRGELTEIDQEVVDSLKEQDLLTHNVNTEFEGTLTFGQRVADKVAAFGGSWTFIITFMGILFLWILTNAVFLARKPFDPFPYILLNLVLSCVASMQAPVIMMSQNRQESKDRLRGEHDYQVNLKAELEIQLLHEKLDHLIRHQWQRLMELQEIQTQMMEDLRHKDA